MLRKWLCQADVTIRLEPVDPVLVKSGYATVDGPDMVPVSTFRGDQKVYYLPGSSLKGVMRSHLERIARSLREASVCLPYFDPAKQNDISVPVPAEQASFGCGYLGRRGGREGAAGEDDGAAGRGESSAVAYRESCAACRIFGSLRFAGRLSIGDAYEVPENRPQLETRNGVGIDRFTGGTVQGVLFDLQALVGGAFRTHLRLANFELWQLAALDFLLTDLRDEMIHVGSGRSRGLGRVRGVVEAYHLSYLKPVEAILGLADLSSEDERREYGLFPWPAPALSGVAPSRQGLRHKYDLTGAWGDYLAALAPSFERFLDSHRGPAGRVAPERAGGRR